MTTKTLGYKGEFSSDVKFADMDGWVYGAGMEHETDRLQSHFAGIGKRFDGVDRRLDFVDVHLDKVDTRLDGMDKRFDGLDNRLDRMDRRFDRIETEISSLRYWLLGSVVTILIGVAAIVISFGSYQATWFQKSLDRNWEQSQKALDKIDATMLRVERMDAERQAQQK